MTKNHKKREDSTWFETPNRKAAKQAEIEAFQNRVKAALAEAHAAASAAGEASMKTAALSPEALVKDLCGGAALMSTSRAIVF